MQHKLNKLNAVVLAAVLSFLPASVFGQNGDFQNALNDFVSENEIAGGALYIWTSDEEIELSTGVANRETGAPVSAETRFYVASSGKMVVAAAVLALVEKGDLELDAKAWPLINDLPRIDALEGAKEVTLRQLLNHTSGLTDYLSDDFFTTSMAQPTHQWTEAEAIAFAYNEPAYGTPGDVFEYSNSNYVLLSHILKRFYPDLQAALDQNVLIKSDMQATSVGAHEGDKNLAHGYAITLGDADVSQLVWASTLGDGPLVSTAKDMANFMRALLIDGKIIGSDLLHEMLTGSSSADSYGLGMGLDGDDWGEWYGHAGSYDGFEADVRYYPDEELVMVYTVNGNTGSEASFLDDVAEIYFDN